MTTATQSARTPTEVLLVGGTVATMDGARRVIDDGAVLVRDGTIVAVGTRAEVEALADGAERIDVSAMLVTPGLINTHTHLFQGLLKGPGDDRPLYRWLREMTAPAAVALTEEDCEAAALLGAVEAIRSGSTTIVDFMYPHPRPYLTDAVIRGLETARIRAVVGRGFLTTGVELGIPPGLPETADAALTDAERLVLAKNRPDALVTVGVAPCLIWMVDEAALRATREFATSHPVLITYHLAETTFEVDYTRRTYASAETELLERLDFLGPDLLAVHCTKVDAEDIARLRAHDVRVSHNPVSNMYLASGVAPVVEMLRQGVTVGLATDGPASNNNQNMVHVLKFAALLQKVAREDPTALTAPRVLEMATIDGARAIGQEETIGSLEPGKRADIAVFDLDDAFVGPVHEPISSLVYAALGSEARTVLVDGRVVMRDRRLTTLDEAAVLDRARSAAHALARRAGIRVARPWGGVTNA
jgi:5-methylthioadenosine/S-adenosylhomocysteine deaminase